MLSKPFEPAKSISTSKCPVLLTISIYTRTNVMMLKLHVEEAERSSQTRRSHWLQPGAIHARLQGTTRSHMKTRTNGEPKCRTQRVPAHMTRGHEESQILKITIQCALACNLMFDVKDEACSSITLAPTLERALSQDIERRTDCMESSSSLSEKWRSFL